MPKLDLTRASRIKTLAGEVMRLKGPGFAWANPNRLLPYYASGAILIHYSTDGAVLDAGGFATALANQGGAGAVFDAAIVQHGSAAASLPIADHMLTFGHGAGYGRLAAPADLVGVRLIWVMNPVLPIEVQYRLFGGIGPNTALILRSGRLDITGSSVTNIRLDFRMPSEAAVYEMDMAPDLVTLTINGVQAASTPSTIAQYRVSHIGAGDAVLAYPFQGRLGDVLGVVTGLPDSDAAIAAARAYLAARFGLGIAS